jgi:NADH-quinone oxidoreductase subunit N
MTFNPADLEGVLPAIILSVGALFLLTSEVFLRTVKPAVLGHAGGHPTSPAERAEARLPPGSQGASEVAGIPPDRRYQAWVAAAFAAIGLWVSLAQLRDPAVAIFNGAAASDGFGRVVSAVVCGSLLLSCIVAFGYLEALRATRGEFYALALFSAAGMCLLGQATDLIVVFISLEVMSLAVYSLTAYLRRGKRPAEAAFKYFVLGSFASAIFLYGAALAYGATASTRLSDVAAAGVKVAAFATLVRILLSGFGDPVAALGTHGWQRLVVWLAGLTMIVGNLLAIPQRSVKRMLAYSSIAHAGYLLVAVAAMAVEGPRQDAMEGLLFYLAAYGATIIGAFGVVAIIERKLAISGVGDDLSSWAGLSERHPGLSAAMSLFMVSLAGIPPTAGFMAKLTVFRAAVSAQLITLAVLGVLTSVGGLYYYLRVVVYVYMMPTTKPEAVMGGRLVAAGVALVGCALLVVWMGVQPGVFASVAQNAVSAFSR